MTGKRGAMKKICGLLTIMLFPLLLFANSFTLNQGYVDKKDFCEVLRYEPTNGLVILTVKINNAPRRFLLDTGAPTVIKSSIQKRAGFEVIHSIATYDINEQTQKANVVRVHEMELGDLVVKDVPALLADDDNVIFNFLGVDGIIGSNMLRHMVVKISAANRTVTFTNNPLLFDLSAGYSEEMALDKDIQSSPVIKVHLGDGVTEELLFDTGFDGFYNVAKEKFDLFRNSGNVQVLRTEQRSDVYGMYGEEVATSKSKLLIPEYKIGGFCFKNVVAYTTNSSNSKLGAKLLNCGDVILDYINERFYLQPYSSSGSISMEAETEAYYCVN